MILPFERWSQWSISALAGVAWETLRVNWLFFLTCQLGPEPWRAAQLLDGASDAYYHPQLATSRVYHILLLCVVYTFYVDSIRDRSMKIKQSVDGGK